MYKIIDLEDPQTLRELATENNSRATPFILEFSRINEDSDIEEEEPDELPVRRGQPIYRQALSFDGYDEDDDNESIETPEPTQGHPLWREGTTPPNKPPFTGRDGKHNSSQLFQAYGFRRHGCIDGSRNQPLCVTNFEK